MNLMPNQAGLPYYIGGGFSGAGLALVPQGELLAVTMTARLLGLTVVVLATVIVLGLLWVAYKYVKNSTERMEVMFKLDE